MYKIYNILLFCFIMSIFACSKDIDDVQTRRNNVGNNVSLSLHFDTRSGSETTPNDYKINSLTLFGVDKNDVFENPNNEPYELNNGIYYQNFPSRAIDVRSNSILKVNPWRTLNANENLFLIANFDNIPSLFSNPTINSLDDFLNYKLENFTIRNPKNIPMVSTKFSLDNQDVGPIRKVYITPRKTKEVVNNSFNESDNNFKFVLQRIACKVILRYGINGTTNETGLPIIGKTSTGVSVKIATLKNLKYMPCNMSKGTFLVEHSGSDLTYLDAKKMKPKDITDFCRKNYIKYDDTNETTKPRDIVENKASVEAKDFVSQDQGCYFLENYEPSEQFNTDEERRNYVPSLYWGNVTYILVYGDFEPKLNRCWIKSEDGTWKNPATLEDFTNGHDVIYYGTSDCCFYSDKNLAENTFYDDLTHEHQSLSQKIVLYRNLKCGYRIIPNPYPKDADYKLYSRPLVSANVVRNTAYVINVIKATDLGFNFDGNLPGFNGLPVFENSDGSKVPPSDGVSSSSPINSIVTPKLITNTVMLNWGMVTNSIEYYWDTNVTNVGGDGDIYNLGGKNNN